MIRSVLLDEPERHVAPALSGRMTRSEQTTAWIDSMIGGPATSSLSADNRGQLAASCWATVIEHQRAIVVLTRAGYYPSARALLRPLFEGYVRGSWLRIGATDREVAVAHQDRFPTFRRMIDEIEIAERDPGARLTELKAAWWGRMCNPAPEGFQPAGTPPARAGSSAGLEAGEAIEALAWADWTAIRAVRGIGLVTANADLVRAADQRVLTAFSSDAPPAVLAS